MKLYTLMYGRSKKRMKPIMTDSFEKCDAYKKKREATKGSDCGRGWHDIVEAAAGADQWKQKTATIGGNKDIGGCKNGYISKRGFNPHT